MVEDYILWSTHLTITSVTAWHPDDGLPRDAELDLAVRVELGSLTALAKGGASLSLGLGKEAFAELIELGRSAVAEGGGHSGVDTAIGRAITAFELTLVETHTGTATRATYSMNHCAPSNSGPASWHRLLATLAAADSTRALEEPLEWFRGWFQPL